MARPSKMRNIPTEIPGVGWFPSKREAHRWMVLSLEQRAGEISGLRRQVPFPLHVNGVVIGKYVADFVYYRGDRQVVDDAKGVPTQLYKWKKKHFQAEYGISILES